jgi:protoporphyrinogen oxidase
MDGVIAAYSIGKNPYDFLNKRPLMHNIKNIEEVTSLSNVELHILSICRKNKQEEEKNIWLDKYAPFFKKENRVIISKESRDGAKAKDIKLDYLKNYQTDKQIVLVDDDNEILKYVRDNVPNIIVMQDSELVD